jgi:hypothetical protein
MTELKLFPVLFGSLRASMRALDCPEFVRWDALNEAWAHRNHSQTLERLAQRGGLDPTEIVANIEKRQWRAMRTEDAVEFIKRYTPGAE